MLYTFRYGFKEGQGLGRLEQGMSSALLVEKTSKRGGRIVHEKDIMPPPPPVDVPDKKDPPITEIMKNPSKVNNQNVYYSYYSNLN